MSNSENSAASPSLFDRLKGSAGVDNGLAEKTHEKELFMSIVHLDTQKQKEFRESALKVWKENPEQAGDICIIGIRA